MSPIDALVAANIRTFVRMILHGDERHRQWLIDAGEAFIARKPMPPIQPPALTPTKEAE